MLGILFEAPWFRLAVFASLVFAIQTTLFADLRWNGAGADTILLLAMATGIAAGPVRGARSGFVLGLAFDLLLLTPFGLSALVYGLCAFLVGFIQPHVYEARRFIAPAVVAAGSVIGTLLYAVSAAVFGVQDALTSRTWRVVVVVTIVNAVLSLPFVKACRWMMLSGDRTRW